MMELLIVYGLGLAVGGIVTWFVCSRATTTSDEMIQLAHDSCTQAAFIAAASDVCDEETCRQIKHKANERLAELDIPGDPRWNYDSED